MVKRGRPSLNLTPEERVQRRRLQLVASQRKRRAHKRLAQQPKATESPDSLPVRPDEEALCQFYDAMFSDGDATNASAARKMPSSSSSSSDPHHHPHPHSYSPPTVCHNCGSAPLDMAALTAVVSAHSPASLMRTSTLRTDTYASSSRLAGPTPSSSAWDEYPSATAPDKPGIDQHFFTDEHLAQAYGGMPLLDSILDSLEPLGIGLGGNSLLGESTPTSNPEAEGISAPAPAKETENVFLLGRFSTVNNEWMPTNGNETSYAVEKAIASRRPPSPSPEEDDDPTLSGDSVDPLPPWAGAKQLIFMGL
ncbi:hypothetical protein TsFJ059_008200 [Trichoderma semiorbis]|uniref:Uncharacterized protein n=1 Tax=Trichoderma semiorbis TaxID=1491008 RepID=A0A9P8HIM9_9HYPO|nr:hypothetical protein TsFJ059_008200 [Trichoderma semiorbis]